LWRRVFDPERWANPLSLGGFICQFGRERVGLYFTLLQERLLATVFGLGLSKLSLKRV